MPDSLMPEASGSADLTAAVLGTVDDAAATTTGTLSAKLRGLLEAIGVTTGAAIAADGSGTLQQYIRSLLKAVGWYDDAAAVTTGTLSAKLRGLLETQLAIFDSTMAAQRVSRAPDSELPSTNNSSTTSLGAGATFTGTTVDVTAYESVHVKCLADQASAASGLVVEFSPDGTNWDYNYSYTLVANTLLDLMPVPIAGRYMRVRLTNGGVAQTSLALTTTFKIAAFCQPGSFSSRNSTATLLANGASFTGTWVNVSKWAAAACLLKTDQAGVLQIQWSQDATNICLVNQYSIVAATGLYVKAPVPGEMVYCRVYILNNSGVGQTYLRAQTRLSPSADFGQWDQPSLVDTTGALTPSTTASFNTAPIWVKQRTLLQFHMGASAARAGTLALQMSLVAGGTYVVVPLDNGGSGNWYWNTPYGAASITVGATALDIVIDVDLPFECLMQLVYTSSVAGAAATASGNIARPA